MADRDEIRSILDKDPVINMRLYSLLDDHDNPDFKCYRNASAVLIVSWSLGMIAGNVTDIIPLLDSIPSGNWFINAIDARILPELEKKFTGITVTDECNAWTLESLTLGNIGLNALDVRDASLVDQGWSYKSKRSVEHIERFIKNFPSSVIRDENGKLVAWAFCYAESSHFINIGGLYVLPAYRRQGHAQRIMVDMCQKVFRRGKKPLVHVNVNNRISQNLMTKLGFVKHGRIIFGRLKL